MESTSQRIRQVAAVVGLIGLGITVRLACAAIPNFAPVASIALFAGYLLPHRRWAVVVPLAIMFFSDLVIGGYQGLLMVTVYGTLALPAVWGSGARRTWPLGSPTSSRPFRSVASLTGLGIVSSLLFFLTTNLATWWLTPWYDKTWAGLGHCYLRGLEFFRYTLAGDLVFSFVLFGSLAIAYAIRGARQSEPTHLAVCD